MKIQTVKLATLAFLLAPLLLLGTGCESQGPAERAGENIDRGIEDAKDAVQDAVDPAGPAEKAGRELDRAVNP